MLKPRVTRKIQFSSADTQVEPIGAQSLAGVHGQLLLDSRDPVAWSKLIIIVLAEQLWVLADGVGGADEARSEVLFSSGLQSGRLLKRIQSAFTPLFACISRSRAYTRSCWSWLGSCDLLAAKELPTAAATIAKARAMAIAILSQVVALRKPKILRS